MQLKASIVVHGSLCLVAALLLVNAVCVVYNELMYDRATTDKACKCQECGSSPQSVKNKVEVNHSLQWGGSNPQFAPIKYFIPPGASTLGPLHSRDTLTRIGSDLSFDYSTCPKDSIMLSATWREMVPQHSSCPAVFIVGARKAGTTSMYQYLSNHPEFEGIRLEAGSKTGETFHFSSRYETEYWDQYMAMFPKQYLMTGDASVGNLVNCKVPGRIFTSCGNFSKIIIMLRHPIDRYISNFMMRTALGTRNFNNNTKISTMIKMGVQYYIDKLVSSGIDITKGMGKDGLTSNWAKLRCLFGPSVNMVYEGLYYIHVLNWICNYPSENILIVNSEELFLEPSKILKEVYQFLGLDILSDSRRNAITSIVYNKRQQTENDILKDADRKKLRTIYRYFNDEILKLLNWDKVVNWT